MKILDLLKLTYKQKYEGVWLSGIEREGEFKTWHRNGSLFSHSVFKNGNLHGERKWWNHDKGNLIKHELWEDGKLVKDYK